MILTDVLVPSLNREYDFELDENVPIQRIIEELLQLISRKEGCLLVGDGSDWILCDRRNGRILSSNMTLNACEMKSGAGLILV